MKPTNLVGLKFTFVKRGEQPVGGLVGIRAVGLAQCTKASRVLSDAQAHLDEDVLQRRSVLVLAAIAFGEVAAEKQVVATVGLLALVTEHRCLPIL